MVAIGDEILAGHVHESNSHFVARTIKPLGIRLKRVEICSDEVDDIEATLRRVGAGVDYLLTSGGLGPTPDDRTMQGVAQAAGAPLVQREEDMAWMRARVAEGHRRGYFESPEPNEGLWKMTYLPAGCEVMRNHIGTALGAIITFGDRPTTLFTLPGPPGEFERMFHEGVLPLLETGASIHTEELVIRSEESRFYGLLVEMETKFPDVQLGSYPEHGQIRLRATGQEGRARALIAAVRERVAAYL